MSYFITARNGDYIEAILDAYTDFEALGDGYQPGSKAHIAGVGDFTANASGRWCSEQKTLEQRAVVTLGTSLTYSGSEQTQTVSSVKIGAATLTANTDYEVKNNKATNAGGYALDIVGKGAYVGIISVPFSVAKMEITKPTKSADVTWTGSEVTVTLSNYNASYMSVTGNKGTDVGSYTAVVSLNDTENCSWADGSTDDVYIEWSITKATGTLSISDATKSVAAGATAELTLTTNSDGVITVTVDDDTVASATLDDDTITVTGVAAGTAVVTASVAESEHYTKPNDVTCTVTVTSE